MDFVKWVNKWSNKKLIDRMTKTTGTTICPWCKQIMERYRGSQWVNNVYHTEIICGNCHGSSEWEFDFALHLIGTKVVPSGIITVEDVSNIRA